MGCSQGKEKKTRHYGRKLLFIGPADSGKTTSLYYLKLNQVVKTIRTPDFIVETIHSGTNSFDVIDIGGAVDDRRVYTHFMEDTGMVVLFIDSTGDEKRLKVAVSRLELVLSELPLRFVPVAIVASKQDLDVTLTCERMTEYLHTKPFMQYRYWRVFPVSVYNDGEGFPLMLQWVDENYGFIMEEGPEYQEIVRFNQEQALIQKQQELGLKLMLREQEKIQFEKNKLNKSKMKAKLQRQKRRDKLRKNAVSVLG